MKEQIFSGAPEQTATLWPHCFMDGPLPVQVGFVFTVEAQQHAVEGEAPDPPASLDGAVLWMLGELEHIQPSLSIVTQNQEAPQRERELVHLPPSSGTTERGQSVTVEAQ